MCGVERCVHGASLGCLASMETPGWCLYAMCWYSALLAVLAEAMRRHTFTSMLMIQWLRVL
jgi:hypothetical protein